MCAYDVAFAPRTREKSETIRGVHELVTRPQRARWPRLGQFLNEELTWECARARARVPPPYERSPSARDVKDLTYRRLIVTARM